MTSPSDLLDAIVESLQDIAGLVAALGDVSKIAAYKHQWPSSVNWQLAVWKLKPPAILVHYRGTRNGRWGNIPSRVHDFSLFIRDGENGADISTLWCWIVDGVPANGSGLKWPYEPIDESVTMIQLPEFASRTLLVSEDATLDYHEVQFSLTEKFAA